MAVEGGGGEGGGGLARGIEAGRAFVTLAAEDKQLKSGLAAARRTVLDWGAGLAKAGAGVAGLGAAITGPILGAMYEAVQGFNEVRRAADQLGSTTEIVSGLAFAAKSAGVDLDGFVQAGQHLGKLLSEAAEGGNASAEAFARLGLDAKELIKAPLDEQFNAIADAIAGLPTQADQARAAMELLGRTGKDMLPALRGGAAGLAELKAKAKDLGAIVSPEDAQNAKVFTGALKDIKAALGSLVEAVGAAVLPQAAKLREYADAVVATAKAAREFIEENRDMVVLVLKVGGAIAAAGAALVAIGTGLAGLELVAGGFGFAAAAAAGFLGFVAELLPALLPVVAAAAAVTAAVVGIAYAFGQLDAVWSEVVGAGEAVAGVFAGVGRVASWAAGVLSTAWAGVLAALKMGDVQGALTIVRDTLDVLWAAVKVGAQAAWNWVKEMVLDTWDDISGFARKAIADIGFALEDFGTDIKGNLIKAFAEVWNTYREYAKQSFVAVIGMAVAAANEMMKIQQRAAQFALDVAKNPLAAMPSITATVPAAAIARAAGEEIGKGQGLAAGLGVDEARKLIEAQRQAVRAAIDKATEDKKAARHAADAAALDEQIANLKRAELKLQQDANDLEVKRNTALFAKDMAEIAGTKITFPKAAALAAIGTTRGQFGALNLAAQFGAAGSAGDKIEKNTKRTADNTDEIKDKVGGLNGW